jgi:hypothetical protein
MEALPAILMPLSREELRPYYPPYKAPRDGAVERASIERMLDRFEAHSRTLKEFRLNSDHGQRATRAELDEVRSIQRDEQFWTAAYLVSCFRRPTEEERVQALAALLSRAFGPVPPFDEQAKGAAAISSWADCLRGDLRLFLEPGLSSPEPYRQWIRGNLSQRQPLSLVREAFDGSGIEGRTHADALLWNPANKFALYVEAKVLADADCMITYDALRNQITRYVDAILEPTRVPIGRRHTNPRLTLFALLTPRMFKQEWHARLYGRLMTEYQDAVAGPGALEREMPYRKGMNWSEVIPRIGWLTWEDCLEVLPSLRSELSPAGMDEP